MLQGEHNVILDEKNRLTLPAGLRKELETSTVVLSKGADKCLWLYTSAEWEEQFANIIKENTDPFSKKDLRLFRKYVASSQTIEIDKAGRVLLPETLREYAGISKDCVVLGSIYRIEIWDEKSYRDYCNEDDEENANEFEAASEELSQRLKKQRGIE
ncbi:MAG: division/cell wall cluster transcriptional repressor MraZ [Treponema sp.]|nr:division/cell wall cluster transcriptional repressor MraZ [Treponema sp.]